MRHFAYFIGAGILALAGPASASSSDPLVSVESFTGHCVKVTTPEGDFTRDCETRFYNLTYRSGLTSFKMFIDKKFLISFAGHDRAVEGDHTDRDIVKVVLTVLKTTATSVIEAKGVCTDTKPLAAPRRVTCDAVTTQGVYSMHFVSDGTPSHVTAIPTT